MFRGASSIALDSKGRIAVPARYRDKIHAESEGEMIVTIDLVLPCLLLFPLNEWERLEQELNKLSSTNPTHARIKRILITHASECEIDKAGRILLPQMLREHAGLGKNVVIAGLGKMFQIWQGEAWSVQIRDDIEQHRQELTNEELPDLPF